MGKFMFCINFLAFRCRFIYTHVSVKFIWEYVCLKNEVYEKKKREYDKYGFDYFNFQGTKIQFSNKKNLIFI